MSLIRTVSGVRGIVGEDLNADTVYRHTAAFSALLPPGPVLLARDSRPHGKELMAVASQALRASGRRIAIADIVPTPTAQFLVPKRSLAGAIVLTASHNPVEYNGLKFIGADGCFLGPDQVNMLFSRADQMEPMGDMKVGRVRGQDLMDAVGLHIRDVLDLGCIDVEAILRRKFRVVVDAVNGAAYSALPTVLEALNCEVICLHTTPDGTFPRGPEPLPQNLTDLSNAVPLANADLGMATDPDGDRLALVDETGRPIGDEWTQVIAMDAFLRRTGSKKPITTNLSSSMLVDHVARRHGVEVLRSSVGEINVVNMMRSVGGEIGGEGNGGIILAESHYGRDSLVGAALILEALAYDKRSLGALVASMPQLEIVKDKVSIDGLDPDKITGNIADQFKGIEQNNTDGLKLIWEDKWIHIRKSNTEPIIRIYAEAADVASAESLVSQIKDIVAKS